MCTYDVVDFQWSITKPIHILYFNIHKNNNCRENKNVNSTKVGTSLRIEIVSITYPDNLHFILEIRIVKLK